MKCFVAVVFGLMAVASANPGAPLSYSYANPAGTTFFGFNAGPAPAPLVPQAPLAVAPVAHQYAAPAVAPVAQYAAPVAVAAPALAVHQKVGYAHTPVLTRVPGVANVPVTKLAYSQGVAQKLVDVAQPAVTTRKFKVRRPALRKEFYDIEHRIIVRPAGSATLELSQPLSKEQKGPAVLTPTNYQQVAPVVRYGTSRRIIDNGVSPDAAIRVNLARGIGPAGPAPQGPPQQAQLRNAGPAPRPLQLRPQGPPQDAPQPPPAPQFQQQQQQPQEQQFQQQQGPQQFQQQQGPQQFQQQQGPQQFQQQQGPQQFQQQQGPQFRNNDAEIIESDQQQFNQQPQQQQPQPPPQQFQPRPQPPPAPVPQGPPPAPQQQRPVPLPAQLRGLNISPDMPAELQARLLELLSAKGGTVTELIGQDGRSDSASVLQVADALQDINLQGGERITTRRIVVTRPIETVQEVDIQEPATKVHRVAVDVPFIQKHHIQGVAQVPVDIPAVKHLATPVVKTTYAQAAYAHPGYAAPGYAAPGYAY